ncbi:hypothetical protein tinsulaeT_37450 [Thalassotalea insulae]|uniref:HPt domain-containing protein n=1 Tax=Thalassotalea insulae TaxID=2056778 RepID=A0ABQ6H043_9GAMM|nr:Hpt domain-containing protein [Thalassotalea insulae]GLX80405.1 hypothetical protein tinsulaeT_37450 [Thalassotalea insulae]
MNNKKQVLNKEVMINLIGDDQVAARKFEIEFLKQAKDSIAEITAYFNQERFKEISEAAHYLKTSANAIGAEITADHLQQLENCAINQDSMQCKQQIIEIHQAVKQVYAEVVNND